MLRRHVVQGERVGEEAVDQGGRYRKLLPSCQENQVTLEINIKRLFMGKRVLILNNEQTCEFMPILNGATIRRSRWRGKRVRERIKLQESAVGENVDSFGDWCQLYI